METCIESQQDGLLMKWNSSWIPGIAFWVLFLGSLALAKRYPWLDTIWYFGWMLVLLVVCASMLSPRSFAGAKKPLATLGIAACRDGW